MKYAIQVHPIIDWKVSQRHARILCDQLLSDGNEILAVFFYGCAGMIADKMQGNSWSDWDAKTSPLLVCSTLATEMNINCTNPTIVVTGMARWMQILDQADQLITIP